MKVNNFYVSCLIIFFFLYFGFLLRYVIFSLNIYLNEKVFFWDLFFFVDNLKTTFYVWGSVFLFYFFIYKNSRKKDVSNIYARRILKNKTDRKGYK